jgi:hypothetical protein
MTPLGSGDFPLKPDRATGRTIRMKEIDPAQPNAQSPSKRLAGDCA